MQRNEIQKITIKGFRGVKKDLDISLKKQSFLLYGDNGTGKSTITDSIEWFLYDKISHLKGEEIPKNAGIRNKELNNQDICQVEVEFSNSPLNSKKTLETKNNRFVSRHSNNKDSFKNYLNQSQMENLMIRSDELTKFIISTKSERLSDISNLIGYSEVKKTKEVLKKSVNSLKRTLKTKSFDSQISSKQADLLKVINTNINTEEQFFSTIHSMIKELNLGFDINSWESFKKLEKELAKEKPDPKLQLKTDITKELSNIKAKESVFNQLLEHLSIFQNSFKKIFEDKQKLKGIKIKPLLKNAEHIIKTKILDEKDKCPLCLQDIPAEELLNSIKERLDVLQTLEDEIEVLKQNKNNIEEGIRETGEMLKRVGELSCMGTSDFSSTKEYLEHSLKSFRELYKVFSRELNFDRIDYYDEYICKAKDFSFDKIKSPLDLFKNSIKESGISKIDMAKKINLAKACFQDIQKLKNEETVIRSQIKTVSEIYKSFSDCQKNEMELFLDSTSTEMNQLFVFMNPTDNIKDIKLKPILDNEDDFVGISYHLNFRNTALESPKMLMSESYINCLGLCLFLSSVKIFNKKNNFFILDDIISSFDKNHRQQFGQLLVNKFSEWQILVLTHEDEWFKYLSSLVKPKSWLIKQIKWNNDIGSFMDEPILHLKESIRKQIEESNVDVLGNKLRKYVENLLKQICENLGAEMKFKSGATNEKRTLEELLSSLLARVKKKKMDSNVIQAIENLRSTQFFGNEASHDNLYNENLADMKACFHDIENFEKYFICSKTGEKLSAKDASNDRIQTKSGHLSYNWQ